MPAALPSCLTIKPGLKVSFEFFAALAFTIIIPVVTGIIKFRQVTSHGYLPVFLFVCIGFLNNVLSYYLIKKGISNHLNSNIYVLIGFLIVVWQFAVWNAEDKKRYWLVSVILMLVWLSDNLIINHIWDNNSIFRFFASFAILFLCLAQVNKLIFFHTSGIVSNPVFLVCIGLMLYYSFKAFVETFYFFSWVFDTTLIIRLNITLGFVDMVTNVLISIAFLCIGRKTTYYPY